MRRLISIPAVLLLAVLCTAVLPLLQITAVLIGLIPGLRGAVPTTAFLVGYLWCETAGILSAAWITLRHRSKAARFKANFAVQCWWASSLKRLAGWLYQLEFTIHGREHLQGGPALVLPRHTSIADTVLPVTYFAKPFNSHLRYVMKRELLYDPCLDIYGHRLPNFFVDRSGQDSSQAIDGVSELTATLTSTEGVLIYPEGTRYSPEKHRALATKPGQSQELLGQ
ncbi:MAG: 1-acyl-sn-glycerol-3-phosphate acyltransferase, partial [Pseudomonadales bacterium]